ncbi:MAG: glycosyltransferase family 9 protein [Selenomonadaceae bacterium]|nr:glycosyltransferase family 9 protein [Selenomonadaceae bacterium]MBR1858719.1 glycosyltransferase family 9 protein [Selenomonadaceae bacterium]
MKSISEDCRILIVKLSSIGDVLHSTVVAHNLKLHYPHCHITWLVSPPASVLLEGNPYVDKLIVWDRRAFDEAMCNANLFKAFKSLQEASKLLAESHFDVTIDIQSLLLTGILSWLSNAPRRIGIHERHEGNSFFMTEMADDTNEQHKIFRYMAALRPLGIDDCVPGLILNLPDSLDTFAEDFWRSRNIDVKKLILFVHMRTSWESKNWSPQHYNEVLNLINSDVQIVFSGSKDDSSYIEQACVNLNKKTLSIAGEVNLLELAALFKTATLLLTCDTGPLHIAEAVGLKTLSLWGPTSPEMYGPLTPGHFFIITPNECRFCCKTKCKYKHNDCMDSINPKLVAKKIDELIADK